VRQATLQLQRLLVQKAMQDKADTVDESARLPWPARPQETSRARWVDAYCGKIKLVRTHGWCPHCQHWVFPADRVLGLRDDSTASPLVQEMCALLVSKMPAEQAETLSLRVTGRSLSRCTLAREAQRQGDSALVVRQRLVNAPVGLPSESKTKRLGGDQPPEPLPWSSRLTPGTSANATTGARREKCASATRSQTLALVYTATCFRLNHRCTKGRFKTKLRALITERSYVATRGGVEPLMKQLYYEARARGLGQANGCSSSPMAPSGSGIWWRTASRMPSSDWTSITPTPTCGRWPTNCMARAVLKPALG